MFPSNHCHHQPVLARASKYCTLCDLPVELLSIVISQIKDDRRTLRSCTLVCHCMRAVAIEHLLSIRLFVTGIVSFDGLLSFLQGNPAICKKTRALVLLGETRETKNSLSVPLTKLDAAVVSRLLHLLPNLVSLRLGGFIYSLPPHPTSEPLSRTEEHIPPPFHLDFLSFGSPFDSSFLSPIYYAWHHKSLILGLSRILSLFSIDELVVRGNTVSEFKPSARPGGSSWTSQDQET